MSNPLSAYGVRDIDYAMAVGMAMGEAMNEGVVGMGLVAATALNRAQNPGSYLARSAALGDIFSAPFAAEAMVDATMTGRSLSGKGRQFSPTFNSDIRGASTAGHLNFKSGLEAALATAINPDLAPSLGIREDGFARAQVATEVAVKARDMGIDLGLGVEHFAAPGFERQAGVVGDFARFGGHSLSPTGGWAAGVKAPTEKDFAARFAAAAALTGVSIPDEMVSDITAHVGRPDIMAAASIVQREAQDYMSRELGQEVMPGLNYNDLVQPTGLSAIDVPDVTGQLGIEGQNALGFASNFGITPDDPFGPIGMADPIGQVDFAGYLDPVGPSLIDGPVDYTGISSLAPAGAFSGQPLGPEMGFTSPDAASLFGGAAMGPAQSFDASWSPGFEGFNAPGMIDQASFDARFSGGFPEASIDTAPPQADMSISSPGALGMGQTFGIEASPFSPSGYAAGVNEGPYGQTPDFTAPSLDARNAMDRAEGVLQGAALGMGPHSSDLNNEAIAASIMSELGPKSSAPALAASPLSGQSTQVASLGPVGGLGSIATQTPGRGSSSGSWGGYMSPSGGLAGLDANALGHAYDSFMSGAQPQTPTNSAAASKSQQNDFSVGPFGWGDKGLTIGGYQSPVDAIKGGLGLTSTPSTTPAATTGLFDGWSTPGLVAGGLGLVTGGIPGAIMGYQTGKLGASLFDSLFGGGGYGGTGMVGDTYSNDRGFTDPGGWSLGNLGDLSGFANGSAYGTYGPATPDGLAGFLGSIFGPPANRGEGGGFSQGGWGADGPGYGTSDGSPGTNGPGIW